MADFMMLLLYDTLLELHDWIEASWDVKRKEKGKIGEKRWRK